MPKQKTIWEFLRWHLNQELRFVLVQSASADNAGRSVRYFVVLRNIVGASDPQLLQPMDPLDPINHGFLPGDVGYEPPILIKIMNMQFIRIDSAKYLKQKGSRIVHEGSPVKFYLIFVLDIADRLLVSIEHLLIPVRPMISTRTTLSLFGPPGGMLEAIKKGSFRKICYWIVGGKNPRGMPFAVHSIFSLTD